MAQTRPPYGAKATIPKPLKSIGNLTTSISTVWFNHDSQLLAVASKTNKDQMRLVWLILCCLLFKHLNAYDVTGTCSGTPLEHVSSVDFSACGEYFAIGNTPGRILLYHLKDYDTHGASQADANFEGKWRRRLAAVNKPLK
jgi:U3 small nucleolar RNA-associated protein 18